MGEMAIMGTEGDVKQMWNAENPEEVAVAKITFDKLTKKGYKAFLVKKDGEKVNRLMSLTLTLRRL